MNTNRNSDENFNEIVFENKNKAYGAYAIRKSYSDHVSISLMISSAFFGILALLAVVFTNRNIEIPLLGDSNDPGTIIKQMFIQPDIKPIIEPKKVEASAPKTTSGQMTPSDDPKNLVDKTNEQQNISNDPNPLGNDSASADPGKVVIADPIPPTPPELVTIADKMPVLDKMNQFIHDNLKYPRTAIENGTKGIVYVTFVVETDGSITGVKLLKGIGDGCEQEAMRVVKTFPKWEPGVLKGKLVRVQCNLPVSFTLK